MAGGTWQTQNKVRPGAYINVIGVPKPLSSVGDRGVVAVPMSLSWGAQLINLSAQDLIKGDSLVKVGLAYSDADALPLRLLFQGAAKAIIYRMNYTVSTKASVTIAGVATVTAKYGGAFGNNISVKFEKDTSGGSAVYALKVYINGTLKLTEKSTTLTALTGNDWVSVAYVEAASLSENTAITPLTGGKDAPAAVAASTTVANVGTVTAKESGTAGNNISVKFEKETDGGDTTYSIKTYLGETLKFTDTQATIAALSGNDLISFAPVSEPTLSESTILIALTGGVDGGIPSGALSNALSAFEQLTWNTLAAPVSESTDKSQVQQFINDLRDSQGIKVQAVCYNYSGVDNKAIINSRSSFLLSDLTAVSGLDAVYYVAGITAGASLVESNSGRVVADAVEITGGPKTHDEIVQALENGEFVLSRRTDGAIIVESDINSLHTFTPSEGYVFSKNRPLRVLDNIANDVKALFISSFLGKVSNDDDGRKIFKADLISYFNNLQSIGAIQNFDSESDITVDPGEAIDAVVVNCWVQPVDSMEKLYMKVNVEG